MSDFDSLREDIAGIAESFHGFCVASKRHHELLSEDIGQLWKDQAALRDELHAVANRLEALTSFVVADPAEVAAKIVTDANRSAANEKRCPTCDGFGKVVKTAENATEPGPIGMQQTCARCAGTGAIYA